MSPNSRHPDKESLRIWIHKDRLQLFRKCAESLGVSMTSMLTSFIIEETNKYIKTQNNKDNGNRNNQS